MALPPTIPTSFVPHPGGSAPQRYKSDLTGAFGFFAYGLLTLVVVLALGVFIYGSILSAQKSSMDADLSKKEAAIDPKTVEEFVRLRDRLTNGMQLLNQHLAFTGFFGTLENLMPATVRLTSLHLSLDDVKGPKLEGAGTAKSFNALAAASNAFATDGHIKDAIFSNITVNQSGSVDFELTAMLDPKLVAYVPSAAPVAAPALNTLSATTTATTTP